MLAVFKQRNTETGSKCRSQNYTKPLEKRPLIVLFWIHTLVKAMFIFVCLFVRVYISPLCRLSNTGEIH